MGESNRHSNSEIPALARMTCHDTKPMSDQLVNRLGEVFNVSDPDLIPVVYDDFSLDWRHRQHQAAMVVMDPDSE